MGDVPAARPAVSLSSVVPADQCGQLAYPCQAEPSASELAPPGDHSAAEALHDPATIQRIADLLAGCDVSALWVPAASLPPPNRQAAPHRPRPPPSQGAKAAATPAGRARGECAGGTGGSERSGAHDRAPRCGLLCMLCDAGRLPPRAGPAGPDTRCPAPPRPALQCPRPPRPAGRRGVLAQQRQRRRPPPPPPPPRARSPRPRPPARRRQRRQQQQQPSRPWQPGACSASSPAWAGRPR